MRRALGIVAVLLIVLDYFALRAAWSLHTGESAMLAFVLIAVTVGVIVAALLTSGMVRDFLPVRIVRVWVGRARAWADANERPD